VPKSGRESWARLRWRPQRKDVFCVLGLIGVALEEMRAFGEPSQALLLLFAALIGLPVFMRLDDRRAKDEEK
jgi:hypothetical protein